MEESYKNLSLAISSSQLLAREFRRALANSEPGSFVDQPTQLNKAKKLSRVSVRNIKEQQQEYETEVKKRALKIEAVTPPEYQGLKALDLAIKSLLTESTLAQRGAIYGNRPYNYVLTPLKIEAETNRRIEMVAKEAYATLKMCSVKTIRGTPTELFIESLSLEPNGARVDLILTEQGPKVIEINLQWVDGIQALSALTFVAKGEGGRPIQKLIDTIGPLKKMGIINLTKGSGSRENGAERELEILAGNPLLSRAKPTSVEILDPKKYQEKYITSFNNYYINGDPKMLGTGEIPNWIKEIYLRAFKKNVRLFPIWRPNLDSKQILVDASQKSAVFAPTLKYSESNLKEAVGEFGDVVLKGDSFSSKKVAIINSEEFEQLRNDAQMFPGEYVLQPRLQSISLPPILAMDTSANRPIYIENPQAKFNVWIIGNEVAGIMASLSNETIISDRDFNTVPINK